MSRNIKEIPKMFMKEVRRAECIRLSSANSTADINMVVWAAWDIKKPRKLDRMTLFKSAEVLNCPPLKEDSSVDGSRARDVRELPSDILLLCPENRLERCFKCAFQDGINDLVYVLISGDMKRQKNMLPNKKSKPL